MKREAFRLCAGLVLVLAMLLAIGLPAMAAYGGEKRADVRVLMPTSMPRIAVAGDGGSGKQFPADSLTNDSESGPHATFFAPYELLPAMPVTGALDAGHPDDYYSWKLAAGQTAYVSVTGDEGTDFDLGLYGPPDESLLGSSIATTYPDGLAINVGSGGAGTYYIRVNRYSGDGEYSLIYGVDTDSRLPGTRLTLPGSPVYSMLDGRTDWFDCFNVYAFAGQTLTCTLDYPPGTDFDLVLLNGSGSIVADTFSQGGYTNILSYRAPTSGTYYPVAWAGLGTGSGWYNLSYSRALKTGTFRPVLYVSTTRLRAGSTLRYWGTVYPNTFARNRMVCVQKRKDGRWVQSRWIKLDSNGRFPKMSASYTRPTTQTIRLYMPAYVDTVRGVNYKAGYSTARTVRWY